MVLVIARKVEWKLSPGIIISSYNSMVRPHINCAEQFWTSNKGKAIELVERVQHPIKQYHCCILWVANLRRIFKEAQTLVTGEKKTQRDDLIKTFKGLSNVQQRRSLSDLFKLQTNSGKKSRGLTLQEALQCIIKYGFFFYPIRAISRSSSWCDNHQLLDSTVDG